MYSFLIRTFVRRAGLCALVTLGLSACGADQGSASGAPPAAEAATPAPPPTSSLPTISGHPITSLNVGSAYIFTPTVTDPNGEPLAFSIQNKPVWVTFNT